MKTLLVGLVGLMFILTSVACFDQRGFNCFKKGYDTGCETDLQTGGSDAAVLTANCIVFYVDQPYGSSCSEISDPQYIGCAASCTIYTYSDAFCTDLINVSSGTFYGECGPVQICTNSGC